MIPFLWLGNGILFSLNLFCTFLGIQSILCLPQLWAPFQWHSKEQTVTKYVPKGCKEQTKKPPKQKQKPTNTKTKTPPPLQKEKKYKWASKQNSSILACRKTQKLLTYLVAKIVYCTSIFFRFVCACMRECTHRVQMVEIQILKSLSITMKKLKYTGLNQSLITAVLHAKSVHVKPAWKWDDESYSFGVLHLYVSLCCIVKLAQENSECTWSH